MLHAGRLVSIDRTSWAPSLRESDGWSKLLRAYVVYLVAEEFRVCILNSFFQGRRATNGYPVCPCCLSQRAQGSEATSRVMVPCVCRQVGEDRHCTAPVIDSLNESGGLITRSHRRNRSPCISSARHMGCTKTLSRKSCHRHSGRAKTGARCTGKASLP